MLSKHYENLEKALEGKDVLINATGHNLHPEFVESLSVFTVFQYNDDPESSEFHSRYIAPGYDLCLIGNIAEVSTYKSWGIKNVHWMPLGLRPHFYDPYITVSDLFKYERGIDLFMMADKTSKWRKERMQKLDIAFPGAHFYGKGWHRGYLPPGEELKYLSNSKISPNIHNSTGPINYRTYYTPANGALLICDNKNYLGEIYILGKEAVGFDNISECIELVDYYLHHDDERISIARRGCERARNDYNEIAVFERTIKLIEKYFNGKNKLKSNSRTTINYNNPSFTQQYFYRLKYWLFDALNFLKVKASKLKKSLFIWSLF